MCNLRYVVALTLSDCMIEGLISMSIFFNYKAETVDRELVEEAKNEGELFGTGECGRMCDKGDIIQRYVAVR